MNEFKVFDEAMDILSHTKKLYPVNNEFLQKKESKENLDLFLNNTFKNHFAENSQDINKYIHYTNFDDETIYGVFINKNKITTVVPYINNLKNLLVNIHERTHLINLLYSNNKSFFTVYSEIVPIFNEYYYLFINNEDIKSFINNLLNNCIISLKSKEIININQLAHIYATIILNYIKNDDASEYFNLFNNININSSNFNYDLQKNDLILSKKMLKNL